MRRPFSMRPGVAIIASIFVLAVSGCATPPPANDPEAVAEYKQLNDPLEPTNRVVYAINDKLDTVLLRPVAVAYNYTVAPDVRSKIHNLMQNLGTPVVLVNDMLQGKPRRAGDTFMRLILNTTIGVGGLFDVAGAWGWQAHDSDLGMTLANWGADAGPYLMLPLFGPSNPRDTVGLAGDMYLTPFAYLPHGLGTTVFGYSKTAVGAVDARAGLVDEFDKIKAQALDPYATVRSLFRQHRQSVIDEMKVDEPLRTPSAWTQAPK